MYNFMDAKLMAKLLRQALADRHIEISHSDSLELIARQFGVPEWNILSAKIEEAAAVSQLRLPNDWMKTGSSPNLFDVGLDPDLKSTVLIKSRAAPAREIAGNDFCTLMQSVHAAPFLGKRLRLEAELRTENVETGATLWFRVDGPRGTLQFDNLELRRPDGPLIGTKPWTKRHVVFEISDDSVSLHYGFFLKGSGACWARNFKLEEVDVSVPVSGKGPILPRPANLDFGSAQTS